MGAEYSFLSEWRVTASPAECWHELDRMLRAGDEAPWWPAVQVSPHPSSLAAGERLGLVVRSPLGYTLRADLTLTAVEPGRLVAAASDGDLRGTGSVRLASDPEGCVLTFAWEVSTQRWWMNATAPLLRPVFAAAHTRVMAAGEKGLREALAS